MIKTLTPHGNSAALILDKPLMQLLHINMNTPLEISTDGENLIISPARSKSHREKLQMALREIDKHHGRTLKKLA